MATDKFQDQLQIYFQGLKVSDMDLAKRDVVHVVKEIVERIKQKEPRFDLDIEDRGSVYEKLKINDADEFDFDLPIKNLAIEALPSNRNAPGSLPSIEYSYYKLQENSYRTWSDLAEYKNGCYWLSSSKLIRKFSELVGDVTPELKRGRNFYLKLGVNHPAVTLCFVKNGRQIYDVDLAPVIKVKQWPENLTQGWEDRKKHGWPSKSFVNKTENCPVYLVSKPPKGAQYGDLWRFAFNEAEKKLLLDANTGVPNSCRRPAIRILKGFCVDYRWPLKSYHLKTLLLHEFESTTSHQWERSKLGERVRSAMNRLKSCLQESKLQHYFLDGINLFKNLMPQERQQVIKDIEIFLANPYSAVCRLNSTKAISQPTFEKLTFEIYVRDLNDRTGTYEVTNDMKVGSLEEMVAVKKGVQRGQFRLIFCGKNLEAGKDLQFYNIKKDSTVEMMGRMRGG